MGMGMIPLIVIANAKCLAAIYFPSGKKRKSRYYKTESQTLKRSGVTAVSKFGPPLNAGSHNIESERSMYAPAKAVI